VSQIEFDEQMAAQIEFVYGRPDYRRRRALVHEALAAGSGERVLDAGCGPGFYVAELLERVGPEGSVVGVDASEPMLALSAKRCDGHDNVEFREGDVTALPVGDGEFDRALCVQVLEYVADIPGALSELLRVLRPGGRALIWDVDWATVSWHSADPARMERVLRGWDAHLTHPSLPRTLAAQMSAAGFEDVALDGHAFVTNDATEETYAGSLVPLIAEFVGTDEAREWAAEQGELQSRGEAYFACIQFAFTATRPA
jgi:arsenite methyltransferase